MIIKNTKEYNIGDSVTIKSLDWYNTNKDSNGFIDCGPCTFVSSMQDFCGKKLVINEKSISNPFIYSFANCCWIFSAEMFEEPPVKIYKIGDTVRIKSIDWYNDNKNAKGFIPCGNYLFTPGMKYLCGNTQIINGVYPDGKTYSYSVKNTNYKFTEEMFDSEPEDTYNYKYKIGDLVVVRSPDCYDEEYGCFFKEYDYCGKTCKIISRQRLEGITVYELEYNSEVIDGHFTEGMFDLKEATPEIQGESYYDKNTVLSVREQELLDSLIYSKFKIPNAEIGELINNLFERLGYKNLYKGTFVYCIVTPNSIYYGLVPSVKYETYSVEELDVPDILLEADNLDNMKINDKIEKLKKYVVGSKFEVLPEYFNLVIKILEALDISTEFAQKYRYLYIYETKANYGVRKDFFDSNIEFRLANVEKLIEYAYDAGIISMEDIESKNTEKPEPSFQPFDKVLVRDDETDKWLPEFFRGYNEDENTDFPYITFHQSWKECIPYEGNEHLVN